MAGIRKFDTGKQGRVFYFISMRFGRFLPVTGGQGEAGFCGWHSIVLDKGAGEIPSAPELVKYVWERVTFKMNAFGPVDSREASTAIIRMLAQGTRSSRFWPLPDILSPE